VEYKRSNSSSLFIIFPGR